MKLLLTILVSSLFFNHGNPTVERWVIERSSNLCIEGRSNVAGFQCDVIEYLNADTLSIYREDEHQLSLNTKGGLTININRIDCHQKYITSDLRKTLKADKVPQLKIELLSIGNFAIVGNKNIKGMVVIDLAGATRKMEVNYTVQADDKNNIQLYGSRDVLFSDFGLTAPSKLAGLIKVENQLKIRFHLVLRSIQTPEIGALSKSK